eukprot:m.4527 g.4527  ORF g.4527 m.4527 type:complete len:205 (+) comp7011_c0_seq1:64-678(+)
MTTPTLPRISSASSSQSSSQSSVEKALAKVKRLDEQLEKVCHREKQIKQRPSTDDNSFFLTQGSASSHGPLSMSSQVPTGATATVSPALSRNTASAMKAAERQRLRALLSDLDKIPAMADHAVDESGGYAIEQQAQLAEIEHRLKELRGACGDEPGVDDQGSTVTQVSLAAVEAKLRAIQDDKCTVSNRKLTQAKIDKLVKSAT